MKFGWKRSEHKPDDLKYSVVMALGENFALPVKVDLRPLCPAVYDQGDLGSCTANTGAGLAEVMMKRKGVKPFLPSRLALYYMERDLEGTPKEDSGATVEDCMKVMSTMGVAHESMWTYREKAFKYKPAQVVYDDAAKHKIDTPMRVERDLNTMRHALSQGHPIAIGIMVYESFMTDAVAKGGVVPMPDKNKEQQLGGHAVLVVGYYDSTKQFIVRNSWSSEWGDAGYFYLPYDYLMNQEMSDDFWVSHTINFS